MHFACEHCRTPLQDDARSCDRCGAPLLNAAWGSSSVAPSGYAVFEDVWRGMRLHYPDGWDVVFPYPRAVAFQSPDSVASLALVTLTGNQLGNAEQVAKQLANALPNAELRIASGNTSTQATVYFRNAETEGRVLVRLTPSGGIALFATRQTRGRHIDLDEPFRVLLQSMAKLKPMSRSTFVCPHEQSFQIQTPAGWRVDSMIGMDNNIRRPRCRVYADPTGKTFVAHEAEVAIFLDAPDVEAPVEEEGFFAKLGRFAKQAGHAMSSAMGQPPMPFDGLGPAAERHFFPRMQQQEPGIEFISFKDFENPNGGQMRVRLPDGSIRVALLEGAYLPQVGPKTWIAAIACWYQAPEEVMNRFESVLRGIADGFKINPSWQANEVRRQQQANAMRAQQQRQMMQAQHRRNMQMQQSFAETSRATHQTNMEILDMQMQSWENQQASIDNSHHNTVQAIREVTDYAAPAYGGWDQNDVLEISSHYDHVWSDPQGHIFAGDWTLDVPPDWEELRPLN